MARGARGAAAAPARGDRRGAAAVRVGHGGRLRPEARGGRRRRPARRADRRPRTRGGGIARGAPARPAREGVARRLRGPQRRQRGRVGAGAVPRSWHDGVVTPSTTRSQPRIYRARPRSRRRSAVRRRRWTALIAIAAIGGLAALWFSPGQKALREITLPLRHEDIIRQQARDKDLDPALIAAVIYQESKFRPRTSQAGALGLMQLLPDTAHFIARKTGGTRFTTEDLSTPQINISYGSWYLRYLTDHFDGNETLAVAAYNAGEHNVDTWVQRAGSPDDFDVDADIPFPETRGYVHSVLDHEKQYREHYGHELGLR